MSMDFVKLVLKKEVGVEDKEREILFKLRLWLDPAPFIPQLRTWVRLRFEAVEWTS